LCAFGTAVAHQVRGTDFFRWCAKPQERTGATASAPKRTIKLVGNETADGMMHDGDEVVRSGGNGYDDDGTRQ
jgi:hypothetical protein